MREEFNRRYILNMILDGFVLYFAYGQEIGIEKMNSICSKATAVGYYTLKGYRFTLDSQGFPNIVSCAKVGEVEGILWLLNKEDQESLSKFKKNFTKEEVTLYLGDKPYSTYTYVSKNPGKPKKAQIKLFKELTESAKFWGFTDIYIDFLEKIATSKN